MESGRIYETLRGELELRGFSAKTIRIYTHYNKDFLRWVRKQPHYVTRVDIRHYLLYLKQVKRLHPNSTNLAHAALKFYYEGILKRKFFHDIPRSKVPLTIIEPLTREEVNKMIRYTTNVKHKLFIMLLYSSGLRVSEALHLKERDIRASQGYGIVRKGKGNKDRHFVLSHVFLKHLNLYLSQRIISSSYIFNNGYRPLHSRTAQLIIQQAARRAGIKKKVTPHLLRHSFATHLKEGGRDIHDIQHILGHKDVKTTERYIAVSPSLYQNTVSPLDTL